MKKHPILRAFVDSLILMAIASVFAELFLTGVESDEARLFVDQCFAYTGYTAMFSALAYVCFRESHDSKKKRLLQMAACVMAAIALMMVYGAARLIGGF